MNNRTIILKSFNTHFFDFLNDLSNILINNNEINQTKIFFETVKKANPTIIIKSWYSFVYIPYKEIIEKGDCRFFLEKNYENDILNFHNSKQIMEGINRIREPIKNMTIENQQQCMDYIKNLSKLSLIYNNLTE
jgi:hypothetical protein